MTTLYQQLKRYNPLLTRESYQSLIDALKAQRDLMLWAHKRHAN